MTDALADLLDSPAANSADVRALVGDWHDVLVSYDRVALRVAARGHADQRYLDALLAARRQAERAAVRHVRAVMAKAGGSE